MTTEADRMKAQLTAKPHRKAWPKGSGLSTGITTLNLGCSGSPHWAFPPGTFVLLVGKSKAGKSWLGRTIFAEACKNPYYAKHRLIDDDPEHGSLMDYRRFWGKTMAGRVEPPTERCSSRTLEECYANIVRALKAGPCVYLVDSEDALYSQDDAAKRAQNARKAAKGQDGKGSYGTSKAKINSASLPEVNDLLARNGSILVMIKQSRDNIGFDAMFNPETRSGGRALTFYASIELWFSIKGKIKRTVRGKPRVIGNKLHVTIKKNRVSGRDRHATFPFYPGSPHGIDDTGAMVDYLIDEDVWKVSKGEVVAPQFGGHAEAFVGSPDKLVRYIESEEREKELRRLVVETWNDIEAACEVQRKAKYL